MEKPLVTVWSECVCVYIGLITPLSPLSCFQNLFCLLWGFFGLEEWGHTSRRYLGPHCRGGRVVQGRASDRAGRLRCRESRGRGAPRPGEGPRADLRHRQELLEGSEQGMS